MSDLYPKALRLEFDNACCRGIRLGQILQLWQKGKIRGELQHANWPKDMADFMKTKVLKDFIYDVPNYDAHVKTLGRIAMRSNRGRLTVIYDARV